MTESTIRPTRADNLLANAVLHLANALDNPCGIAGVGPSCEAARDLVRDLAAPDHAERRSPAPRGPIGVVNTTHFRPDGSLEQQERRWVWPRDPSPAPAPSCDAPHCACADGEDCPANGAAEAERVIVGVDVNRDGMTAHAWTQSREEHRATEGFGTPAVARSRDVRTAVMALQRALGLGEDGIVGPATMQAIEGIRAGGEDERVMVRAVIPLRLQHPIASSDHTRTLVLDAACTGHRAPFRPGDLIVQAEAFEAIQRVVAVVDGVRGAHGREIHLRVKRADVVVDADAF